MTATVMTDYYARRAGEYEQLYAKPERQADLGAIKKRVSGCFSGRNVLEIACGTGYWTRFAARSAAAITASDYNEAVLEIARQKDYGTCRVTFVQADAYRLSGIPGYFSGALVGFWWSHVPRAGHMDFFNGLHAKLSAGARVIVMDNCFVPDSSTPVSRSDNEKNTYQVRTLSDGTAHEILKNFPVENELAEKVSPFARQFEYTELDYFWLAEYVLK